MDFAEDSIVIMSEFANAAATISSTGNSVDVIFDDPSKNLTVFDQQVNSTAPHCVMNQSDVVANDVENGTLITIRSLDYEVVNVAPDGAGLALVSLTNAT